MREKSVVFALIALLSICAFGQGAEFDRSAHDYMTKLEEAAPPVFYSTCKTKGGKAVLVFGGTSKTGMLFEIRGSVVVNSAQVLLNDDTVSLDTTETQGGIYTYTVMTNRAKDLSKLPFNLSLPREVKDILKVSSNRTCVDKPPPR